MLEKGSNKLFGTKDNIKVKVKLYGGLDRLADVSNYNPDSGIELEIEKNTQLKKVLKLMGLKRNLSIICFINGEKVGLNKTLKQGDVIFFMRPASGG